MTRDWPDAAGWYPTEYERRLGLDPDPGRQTSEGSNRHRHKGSITKVCCGGESSVPKNPTLTELHQVEAQREALADEVRRLQGANIRLYEEVLSWRLRFEQRVRVALIEAARVGETQRQHWARCYEP